MIQIADKMTQTATIDLRHALTMVARALDFVGVDEFNHGHRVANIAFKLAQELEWPETRQEFVYFAGLLHDCGVSSVAEQAQLLNELEDKNAENHCIRGYEYLSGCLLLQPYAEVVRYHHTRWSDLQELDIPEDGMNAIKHVSNLILLADRIDFARGRYADDNSPESIILHKNDILELIKKYSGTMFCPEFVDAFVAISQRDAFWFSLDPSHIEGVSEKFEIASSYETTLSIKEIENFALFVSRIVDAKSPFTMEHSHRVALLSSQLAADLGMNQDIQQKIKFAGLLHDVGKLATAPEILDKNGDLSDGEYSRIKRHAYDTFSILTSFLQGTDMIWWAASHHERLDGSGYPFALSAGDIPTESRILAVADVFQALAQDRPYRARMASDEIVETMTPMVERGQLDADIYSLITGNLNAYYKLATG